MYNSETQLVILSGLNIKDIVSVKTCSKYLLFMVKVVMYNKNFWVKRLEKLHNLETKNLNNLMELAPSERRDCSNPNINWKQLCINLETLGAHFAFKNYCKYKECNDEIDLLINRDDLDLDCAGTIYQNEYEGDYSELPVGADHEFNALYSASVSGNIYAVKAILNTGIVEADHYNLDNAAEHGHSELVKLLLENPTVRPEDASECNEYTPLDYACIGGYADIVELLLNDKRDVPTVRCLLHAISSKSVPTVRLLLNGNGININEQFTGHLLGNVQDELNDPTGYLRDIHPLQYAVMFGCIEIAELLIRHRAITTLNGSVVLNTAIIYNQLNIIRLLQGSVNFKQENNTPLRIACSYGHKEIVSFLLYNTYHVTDPSDADNDCIIRAVTGGHYDIVKMLMHDNRVNPSARDNLPIKLAFRLGHYDIVKLLMLDIRVDCTGSI